MRLRNLLGRKYREEEGGAGENLGGAPGGGTGTPGDTGGDEGIKSFRDLIPAEYRSHTALNDYKDMAGLVKSHISLQSMIGNAIPIPKADDADGWNNVYKKLGKPETPDGYQFDLGEQFKGVQLDTDMGKWARDLFHGANLTPQQANKVMQGYLQKETELSQNKQETTDNQAAQWQDQLEQELGPKFEETTLFAERASSRFLDPDTRHFLESTGLGNHPGLVKAFSNIGRLLGEDKVFTEGANSSGFMESPEEAKLQIGKLQTDTEFMKAYQQRDNPGHAAAVERMQRLYTKAFPGKAKS
jgi:hypothetical protein